MSESIPELRIWQTQLYHLQREAPKPYMIKCTKTFPNKPPQYGLEYHGPISRQETEKLLEDAPSGAYLIRESQRSADAYTLVIWFDNLARNYKLFYDAEAKQHYVGEKRFETIELLVADGLIHFNVETRGADVLRKIAEANVYEKSPFYKMRCHTLNSPSASPRSTTAYTTTHPLKEEPITFQRNNDGTALDSSKRMGVFFESMSAQRSPTRLSEWRQSVPNQKCTPLFDQPSLDEPNISEGRRYREWPPLAKLRELMSTERPSPESGISSPPVPPPRSASGPRVAPIYFEATRQNGMTANQSGFVHCTTPKHERLAVDNSALTTTCQQSNNVAGCNALQPPGKSSNNSETIKTKRGSSLSTVFPASQEFDTTSSPMSSGTFSSEEGSSTSGALPMDSPRGAIVMRRNSDRTSTAKDTLVNGSKRQTNLFERYNFPAECLADQMPPLDPDKKKHNFKVHTYIGPNWCDFCTHFIWGLVAQGVKCADCGFQAHKRCSDVVPDDCLPDVKQMKRVFGVDLTSLTLAERKSIPTLLERCVGELEARGALASEGLYRIPGNHDRIEQLQAAFDKDAESAQISESRVPDINVLTSLIKSFLRELPVPLITFDAYPKLLEIVREENLADEEKLSRIASVISTLPHAHYETLRFFMRHIHQVAVNHSKNMMSPENLSTVLAPSLMSSSNSYPDTKSYLLGMQEERKLVHILIKDYNLIFPPVERSLRRQSIIDQQNERPSSQLISPSDVVQCAPNRPVPRVPEQNKRWFFGNRRSVDTPMLTSSTTQPTSPTRSPN